ncbi:MAG: hypothetical protein KDD55_12080, partial [Bdellovibrionales bacterium]|nr:hypothetical protein [Bdellovibrionales bacterium]
MHPSRQSSDSRTSSPVSSPGMAKTIFSALAPLLSNSETFDGAKVTLSRDGDKFKFQVELLKPFNNSIHVEMALDPQAQTITIQKRSYNAPEPLMKGLAPYLERATAGEQVEATYKPGCILVGGKASASSVDQNPPQNFRELPLEKREELERSRDADRQRFAIAMALEHGVEPPFSIHSDFGAMPGESGATTMDNGLAKRHTTVTGRDRTKITLYDTGNPIVMHGVVRASNHSKTLDRAFAINDLNFLYTKHREQVDTFVAERESQRPSQRPSRSADLVSQLMGMMGVLQPDPTREEYAKSLEAMSVKELAVENHNLGEKVQAALRSQMGDAANNMGPEFLGGIVQADNKSASLESRAEGMFTAGMNTLAVRTMIPSELSIKSECMVDEIVKRFEGIIDEVNTTNPAHARELASKIVHETVKQVKGFKGWRLRKKLG